MAGVALLTKLFRVRRCTVNNFTFSKLSFCCCQNAEVVSPITFKRGLACHQIVWSKSDGSRPTPVSSLSTSSEGDNTQEKPDNSVRNATKSEIHEQWSKSDGSRPTPASSISTSSEGDNTQEKPDNSVRNATKSEINDIYLLAMDDKPMGSMSLERATNLAHKKNLKLVKIEDATRRMRSDVYKLMSGVQLHGARETLRAAKKNSNETGNKNDKSLFMTAKITEHDLRVKTKTVKRFVTAGHIVRVTINGDGNNQNAMDQLYKALEKTAVEVGGQALQKRMSEDHKTMKFSLQAVSKKKLKTTTPSEGDPSSSTPNQDKVTVTPPENDLEKK